MGCRARNICPARARLDISRCCRPPSPAFDATPVMVRSAVRAGVADKSFLPLRNRRSGIRRGSNAKSAIRISPSPALRVTPDRLRFENLRQWREARFHFARRLDSGTVGNALSPLQPSPERRGLSQPPRLMPARWLGKRTASARPPLGKCRRLGCFRSSPSAAAMPQRNDRCDWANTGAPAVSTKRCRVRRLQPSNEVRFMERRQCRPSGPPPMPGFRIFGGGRTPVAFLEPAEGTLCSCPINPWCLGHGQAGFAKLAALCVSPFQF